MAGPLVSRPAFWKLGVVSGALVAAIDSSFVSDLGRPADYPDVLTRWHGAPWYILSALAAPVAHAWLVAFTISCLRCRPAVSSWRWVVVAAILIACAVFDYFVWTRY